MFQNARAQNLLPGLGVSFFTKLICFINPNLNGYILDQWTGKSVNLLFDDQLIAITNYGWINDNNTPETYELFCQRIEEIALILGCTPLEAEEKIFSNGGIIRGVWRQYILNHN
jgi:hypothetical protein